MATSNGLVGLLCFALMAAAATATQFRVGGNRGWGVPDAAAEPYNAWAGRQRFLIGDQLLFVYPKDADSVLLVDQASYNACNTTAYITKFEGGSTVFTLDRSGPFYFISGNQASCAASEKLIVVVLSPNHTPPGAMPTPPSPMPPASAPPAPSPMSPPPSPPSMPPASAPPALSPSSPPTSAPPALSPSSPPSPPSVVPPSAAPVPSPSSSPPSPPAMLPPSGTPMPSPMLPPSGAPMPTPESAPSPTGSSPAAAPATTPGSSPATPGAPPSSSPGTPGTPGGVDQPPAASPPAPGADGANSTGWAAPLKAGLISTLTAGFGYAMLAI